MEFLWPVETIVNIFLQNLGSWLEIPMQFFSFLGNETFYLLIMSGLYWCIDAGAGMRIAIVLVASNFVNSSFKLAFHGARPYWFDPQVKALSTETSFGFPSGHAQNAASIWGRLATLYRQKWVKIVMVLIILFIGLSRLYLGVHFASDVVGGWLIGAILLFLVVKFEKPVVTWWKKRSFSAQIILSFVLSLVIIGVGYGFIAALANWTLPAEWIANATAAAPEKTIAPIDLNGLFTLGGLCFGIIGGFSWLEHRGGFDAGGSLKHRFFRYLIGVTGVLIFWFLLGKVFPRTEDLLAYILRFVRYTLTGCWVAALAPMLFIRLKIAEPARK